MIIAASPEHIPEIVALHRVVLGDTVNARLGPPHLSQLYNTVLRSKYGQVWISVDPSGLVVGFISISRDLYALERQMKHELGLKQYLQVLTEVFHHPRMAKDLIDHQRFTRYLQTQQPKILPYILTIGVNPTNQKGGHGAQLIQQASTTLALEGVAEVYVDTKEHNFGAIQFYNKMGFARLSVMYGNVLFVKKLLPRSGD